MNEWLYVKLNCTVNGWNSKWRSWNSNQKPSIFGRWFVGRTACGTVTILTELTISVQDYSLRLCGSLESTAVSLFLGLIHTVSRTEPNRTGPSLTERVPWLMFVLLASRRPILLRNRSNFLRLKCAWTQKRLFLVHKRLLHQILSFNENTCTWFDILAVKKCKMQCFQFGSARLAMWIVTCSARFSSVRSGSARLASARLG